MTVIAYDIDGVLTSEEGRMDFKRSLESENTVGIVTARSESEAKRFIEEQMMNPAFVRSTNIKFMTLDKLKAEIEDDKYVYIGSWMRDKIAAKLAGWEYRQL